ncbi:hypothetical protein J6590_053463 [Homalodisca vitripennis]|nr:hypothetical protein J6590_053463 [Homalodisca vitripennis]
MTTLGVSCHSCKAALGATFCVVSKRFRKNYIHRFTATSSFFLFSPWNTIRRTCIFLSTNQYFDYVVMATILLNCVFLAKTDPVEEAEGQLQSHAKWRTMFQHCMTYIRSFQRQLLIVE